MSVSCFPNSILWIKGSISSFISNAYLKHFHNILTFPVAVIINVFATAVAFVILSQVSEIWLVHWVLYYCMT